MIKFSFYTCSCGWMLSVFQIFVVSTQDDTVGIWGEVCGGKSQEKTIMESCPFEGDNEISDPSLFFCFLSMKWAALLHVPQPYDAASHQTQNTKIISENKPCLFSHELPQAFCYSNMSWLTAYFCFHIRLHQWLYDAEYFSCRELQLRGILETFDNVKRRCQLLTLREKLAFFLKNNSWDALRSSPMIAGTLNATRV